MIYLQMLRSRRIRISQHRKEPGFQTHNNVLKTLGLAYPGLRLEIKRYLRETVDIVRSREFGYFDITCANFVCEYKDNQGREYRNLISALSGLHMLVTCGLRNRSTMLDQLSTRRLRMIKVLVLECWQRALTHRGLWNAIDMEDEVWDDFIERPRMRNLNDKEVEIFRRWVRKWCTELHPGCTKCLNDELPCRWCSKRFYWKEHWI